MADETEATLREFLKQSQKMMVKLSGQCAGEQRNWAKATSLLEGARQIDGILAMLSDQVVAERPPIADQRRLPRYYVEHDRLVKVGRSRDGGTYEHRVTREHFELIVARLSELAKQGRSFETRDDLVDKCDVPAHEPLILVNLLSEHGLLAGVRRGRWSFLSTEGFADAARGIWNKLPTK